MKRWNCWRAWLEERTYRKVSKCASPGKEHRNPLITFVCREAVKLLVEKVAGAKNENLTAR